MINRNYLRGVLSDRVVNLHTRFQQGEAMKLTTFGIYLLAGLVYSVPRTADNKVVITKEFYLEQFVIATANHDIINIHYPLNDLNFGDDGYMHKNAILFFTEADKDANGKYTYKGLYVLKDKKVTKLLEQGTDATADSDNSKIAYFSAKDGVFKYNAAENKAEKYGTIDDSIINIAKVNNTDLFYILTEDHVVYRVTGECTLKEKVVGVDNAQQIVVDFGNNLYFYTPSKEVFVASAYGVKKIEGLPACSTVDLLNPPFVMEEGIPVVLDHQSFLVYPNGTSEYADFEIRAKPTAYDMGAFISEYYAYDKKIYEYNWLDVLIGDLEELKTYLENNKESIQKLPSTPSWQLS